jgi:hypothetical protein
VSEAPGKNQALGCDCGFACGGRGIQRDMWMPCVFREQARPYRACGCLVGNSPPPSFGICIEAS